MVCRVVSVEGELYYGSGAKAKNKKKKKKKWGIAA